MSKLPEQTTMTNLVIEEQEKEVHIIRENDCILCGEDTSFGSGKFVNRIPADDNYMCAECQIDIDEGDN